jgi:hypothetical protein
MGPARELGAALKGALADSECLIAICSPEAVASDWVEREIVHFRTQPQHGPVLAVIANGRPDVSDSPNPRKAKRECLPAALTDAIVSADAATNRPAESLAEIPRKESLARTRARIAAALLDVPFDELWRRDRGRAWIKRLVLGTGAIVMTGVVAFGALAVTGLAMRRANAEVQATSAVETPASANAVLATAIACQASVESVRAWDAAVETGMRAKEYRDMQKLGAAFKEAMYVCAATAAHKPTEHDASALCDRLNDATAPEIPANATDAYAEAMGMMSEQLAVVKASCDKRVNAGGAVR